MAYKSTGFLVGRPRTGETRPLTKKAIARKQYYEANREKMIAKSREWFLKKMEQDPDYDRRVQSAHRARKKAWSGAKPVAVNDATGTLHGVVIAGNESGQLFRTY